jgi:hypothetical protein
VPASVTAAASPMDTALAMVRYIKAFWSRHPRA